MKLIKSILTINLVLIFGYLPCIACGPYYPVDPSCMRMFRSCSPELERQWHDGCRFQDYEKYENCLLWQKHTSNAIPLKDIERVVYDASLKELNNLGIGDLASNQFAAWIANPNHKEDLDYMLVAKEIEELRQYLNDAWYYACDDDDEHKRLAELQDQCKAYKGSRHAARYALQLARLCFAQKDYDACIDLWENGADKMPQDIITDMIASYVGGAYLRKDNREKAIDLYSRSGDIGSLIQLKVWDGAEAKSAYVDPRIQEMEYVFNRFPNSPLLSIKLQRYIRNRERYLRYLKSGYDGDLNDPVYVKYKEEGDSLVVDDEHEFYDELKRFAHMAVSSSKSQQKGMWNYALAYLYYLDGNKSMASKYLNRAEKYNSTPLIEESIMAFRILLDASNANNSLAYRDKLLKELKWLDAKMQDDVKLSATSDWQYDNKLNWLFYYWQDVARKVLLGEVCPRMQQSGNTTLALQLANYASNRIHQIAPLYKTLCYKTKEGRDIITIDEYRKICPEWNSLDYSNQFFEMLNGMSADKAARYAETIEKPKSELDKFLNERSYVDTDYIYDIVGTLYLREMNYAKAVEWLSKVSTDYQARMNISKDGYFKLDPFQYQYDKKQYIADAADYKLRFAQEMWQLEKLIAMDAEPNRKAKAKIRYANGLRNSFGRCWYLTDYGYDNYYDYNDEYSQSRWYTSSDRGGFKENAFAQKAYAKVDRLMDEAIAEFTNPEQAAQAQLEMKNFKTVVERYPDSKAAAYVRGKCDKYYDYSIQKR